MEVESGRVYVKHLFSPEELFPGEVEADIYVNNQKNQHVAAILDQGITEPLVQPNNVYLKLIDDSDGFVYSVMVRASISGYWSVKISSNSAQNKPNLSYTFMVVPRPEIPESDLIVSTGVC